MSLKVGEYKIKITGSANIPEELFLDKSYTLGIANAVVESKKSISNQDGTSDTIFYLRISEMSAVHIDDNGKKIIAKVKGSMAKAQRFAYQQLYEAKFQNDEHFIDFEDFYQKRMSESIDLIKSEIN